MSSSPTSAVLGHRARASKWLKRLVIGTLVLIGLVVLFKIFFGGSGKTTSEGFPKTVEVEIADFKDREICEIPGEEGVRFQVMQPVGIQPVIGGGTQWIHTAIRVNGAIPEQVIPGIKKGCAKMSFSYTRDYKEKTKIGPKMVSLLFYK